MPDARVSVLGFDEVLEVVFCRFPEEIELFLDGGDGGDAFVLFNVCDEFFAVVELVLEDAVPVDGLPEELCMVVERLVRAFLVIARFDVGGVDDDALFFDDAFFDGDGNVFSMRRSRMFSSARRSLRNFASVEEWITSSLGRSPRKYLKDMSYLLRSTRSASDMV